MSTPLTVDHVPLETLVLDPENARLHPDQNLAAITGSLSQFGQREPLVVQQGTNRVIGGNGRLAAMRKLGWKKAAVSYVRCSNAEATALGLALNRTAETATWDTWRLEELLGRCRTDGIDVTSFGFDEQALDNIIARAERDADATEDLLDPIEAPDAGAETLGLQEDEGDIELPAEAITQTGDLYALGPHRLLCGDSTNKSHVARLMDGAQAHLVFTSPPYGQQRDYGKAITDWDRLMTGVFANLPITEDGQVLVNLGLIHSEGEWIPYWSHWLDAMRKHEWKRFGLYVWDQGPGMPGEWHGRLAPAFELLFHFNKKSRRPNKTKDCTLAGKIREGEGGVRLADGSIDTYTHAGRPISEKKIPDNVIRAMRQKGTVGGHPAPFSVGFAKEIVEAYSAAGEHVFEPFTGSGTTILAAHELGRICYGMELEPKYCDIILARFERVTGMKPELIGRAEKANH